MQERSETKDIILKIKGTQSSGPAQDSIELITQGTMRRNGTGLRSTMRRQPRTDWRTLSRK